MSSGLLVLAFLADLLVGDPEYRFHPVRLMGRAIEWGETFLRKSVHHEKIAGGILAIALPVLVYVLVWWVIFLAGKLHFLFAGALIVFGVYSAISVRDLRKEGLRVYKDLEQNNLQKARCDVARIVGRDTHDLSEKEIVRASVETIAESTMDGIVAPLFYAVLGGAPLALAYKAVNTLDSMIGYRSARYLDFGFIAAKQDEFLNWIPARLSYGVIALASFLVTGRVKEALSVGWRYGVAASYGNSAIPEATFAGTLGMRLGGRSSYEGRMVDAPFLGHAQKDMSVEDIRESVRLMLVASWLSLLGCVIFKYGFSHVASIPGFQ